jgi:hypothetical protein
MMAAMKRPNLDYASPDVPGRRTPWVAILAVAIAVAILAFLLFKALGL